MATGARYDERLVHRDQRDPRLGPRALLRDRDLGGPRRAARDLGAVMVCNRARPLARETDSRLHSPPLIAIHHCYPRRVRQTRQF